MNCSIPGNVMAAICLAVVLSVSSGCATGAPRVAKVPTEPIQTPVGVINHPLKVAFGEQLVLLGYNVAPDIDTLKPGETVVITWYWEVREPLKGEWKELTHITDNGGYLKQNCDGVGDIRKSQPPQSWAKGQIVEDRQMVTLKKEYHSPVAQFRIGLYGGENGKRLKPVSGSADKESRVLGPEFKTGVKR
jgi:hypothetical protein